MPTAFLQKFVLCVTHCAVCSGTPRPGQSYHDAIVVFCSLLSMQVIIITRDCPVNCDVNIDPKQPFSLNAFFITHNAMRSSGESRCLYEAWCPFSGDIQYRIRN